MMNVAPMGRLLASWKFMELVITGSNAGLERAILVKHRREPLAEAELEGVPLVGREHIEQVDLAEEVLERDLVTKVLGHVAPDSRTTEWYVPSLLGGGHVQTIVIRAIHRDLILELEHELLVGIRDLESRCPRERSLGG